MKAWQNGYKLDALKALAAPFKAAASGHTFGAFGATNERSVAEALRQRRFQYAASPDGHPVAAVISRRLARQSKHADFAGRPWTMPVGDVYVSAVGALDEPGAAEMLGSVIDGVARGETVWLEALEGHLPIRRVLEALGFSWWATKIAASSDLRGIYRRPGRAGRSVDFHIPDFEVPGLAVLEPEFLLPGEVDEIDDEVRAYLKGPGRWAQHYSTYNKRRSWQAFALHGYQRDRPEFIEKPAEMARSWREAHPALLGAACEPTVAAPHFPRTVEFLGRIPGAKERVRFMRLSPRGELTRHADITNKDAGVRDGLLARLHVPIVSPGGCVFRSWGLRGAETVEHLPPGGLYYLDQRKPHAVRNSGGGERVHLVVDVASGEELRKQITEGRLPESSVA